jgi:hypothetical protein
MRSRKSRPQDDDRTARLVHAPVMRMTPRRSVTLAVTLLFLALVVFGVVVQAVGGTSASPAAAPVTTPTPQAAAPSTKTPEGEQVVRALAAIQRAFNAGDVTRLCRPAALVDPAVIREQNRNPGGCESEIEELVANEPQLHLAVRQLALRRDLASATATTTSGASVSVDLVRHGRGWLLSFSDGNDPMPALAGAG